MPEECRHTSVPKILSSIRRMHPSFPRWTGRVIFILGPHQILLVLEKRSLPRPFLWGRPLPHMKLASPLGLADLTFRHPDILPTRGVGLHVAESPSWPQGKVTPAFVLAGDFPIVCVGGGKRWKGVRAGWTQPAASTQQPPGPARPDPPSGVVQQTSRGGVRNCVSRGPCGRAVPGVRCGTWRSTRPISPSASARGHSPCGRQRGGGRRWGGGKGWGGLRDDAVGWREGGGEVAGGCTEGRGDWGFTGDHNPGRFLLSRVGGGDLCS